MAESQAHRRRVYFALWPSNAVREQIAAIAHEWVGRSAGAAIPVENFHATLAFLGSISAETLEQVQDIAASLRSAPFDFTLDRVETWTAAKVLCLVAAQPAPALLAFASSLRFSLLAQQPESSPQEFRPHVTLARRPIHRIDATSAAVAWPVADFVLVESTPGPRGSEYRILRRWPLHR